MRKALIFGINGMDAKTITFQLLEKDYKVIGTFRRNTLNLKEDIHSLYDYNPNLTFEYCDISDFNSVKTIFQKYKTLDEVYLLAAQSHVGFSFDSPANSILVNGTGVYNVLENIYQTNKLTRTYFAATSELLGGDNPNEPYTEDSHFDCRSPYSVGKELGTRWVKYYRQLGLFVCYGILFNHSNIFRSKDFYVRRVTNSAARITLGLQKELTLGNLDFYRDEHWSDFGCEMMWKMLQNNDPKDYIIANGICHHGEEYLDTAFDYFNLNWKDYVKIDKSRMRPNEVVKLIGNSEKAQKELGWHPNRMPFKDHVSLMCKFDHELESGIKTIRPNVFNLYP